VNTTVSLNYLLNHLAYIILDNLIKQALKFSLKANKKEIALKLLLEQTSAFVLIEEGDYLQLAIDLLESN